MIAYDLEECEDISVMLASTSLRNQHGRQIQEKKR